MKITFLLPGLCLAGGMRVIALYGKNLQLRGHDVSVVSKPSLPTSWRSSFKSLVQGKGWLKRQKPNSAFFDAAGIPVKVLKPSGPITDDDMPDADVIVVCFWTVACWIHRLAPSKGAPAYFVQGHDVHTSANPAPVHESYRLPFHKIVVSRWLNDLMISEYGNEDCSIVPNSVDCDMFNGPVRDLQLTPTVGFIGTMAPLKGLEIALEAIRLAQIREKRLQAIGFGFENLPNALPIPQHLTYFSTPSQSQINATYSGCDAWLFPSRAEGFGLPILEAMACRTPVIATPAGAAPELLSRGGGVLIPHDNPQAMADAILHMTNLPSAQWRSMSDAAYSTATSYSWDAATELFEHALNVALKKATVQRA